jgi:murein L,D-transpeptidase YcbB/YkuD
MRTHIVRDGEYLTQIAAKAGFDADTLWNHPSNADLKAKRPHRDILTTGDIVPIPDLPEPTGLALKKGATNRYVANVPKITMSVIARNGDTVLANEPYLVKGAGDPIEGTTDGNGKLTFSISIHVREGEITLPKRGLSFPLHVGDMDPVSEDSGVKKRLSNLGFYTAPVGADAGDAEQALRAAVAAFQKANGMEANGVVDDAIRKRLTDAHGS